MPSPLLLPWQENEPGGFGARAQVGPSTAPLVSVNVTEVCAGVSAQVPLRNQPNVTVPVGTGREPFAVSVAWSCTVVPAATAVTVACAALWMFVANDPTVTLPTVKTSHGPTLEL